MADAVAILGMACRLPGAETEQALWDMLARGESAIRPVPADRWSVAACHDPVPGLPGRTVMQRGGFLDQIDGFDERFFTVSPREARAMDPQQRMLLEETWHCLEDAGLRPSSLSGRQVGVFAGVMATDYQQNAVQPGAVTDGYSALGTYGAILANRISHAFRWTGPSYTVDAACASSLVALHQARRALLQGECELAIVAAANALINPWRSVSFSNARMLSPDGACRTFAAGANGYVQGEGAVVLLLAREGDVSRLGARARALLLGSAVNHVGPSRGITQPSVASQRAVIEDALADAGVPAASISFVEAHGTGTALGDPIEVAALSAVLSGPRAAPCHIGAIKTNIGHLEAAAGLAGLFKVVLMLERRQLLPSRNLDEVNPLIDFATGPLRPVTEVMPWAGEPLRAGVSAFGFGGANAHAILEAAPEYVVARRRRNRDGALAQPLVLAAASAASLDRLRQSMRVAARQAATEGKPITTLCQALLRRCEPLPYRLAGTVADWAAVDGLLSQPAGATDASRPPRVVLRFGGVERLHDRTWLAMLGDLPALAEASDAAEAAARAEGARRSPRLVTLARLHAIGSLLLQAGLGPDLLYGEGNGFWVTMALSGVVSLAAAVAATGEGQPAPLVPSRPRLAVYDRGSDSILDPRLAGPDYLARLREGLDAALPRLSDLAGYAARLQAANRSFRNGLADWAAAFARCGLPAPETLLESLPAAAVARRLLMLAVAVARRRTCARWTIPETGPLLPPLADELVHLFAAGALPIDAAAALAADRPDLPEVTARLDLSALPERLADAGLPLLAAMAGRQADGADADGWPRGFPGRPRKPAPMMADLTIDIGQLGVAAEGQHLPLPLGEGFHAALCRALCAHWQAGGATRWDLLERRHTRIALPLYPFERRRHWIPLAESAPRGGAAPAEPAAVAEAAAPDPVTIPDRDLTYRIVWSAMAEAPAALPMPLGILGRAAGDLLGALPGAQVIDDLDPLAAILDKGCRSVIITWPLHYADARPDPQMVAALERDCLLPLLKLAAELARRGPPITLVLVGADTGGDQPRLSPALAAASALVRSVAAEAPSLIVGAVAVPADAALRRAAAPLLLGAALGTPLGEAALRPDGIWVRRLEPMAPAAASDAVPSGVWLLIGGLGGIGTVLARHIGARPGTRVAVLGRRPAAEAAADLAAAAGDGTPPLYVSADVTDPAAVAAAIAAVEAALGPVDIVVHVEMVLADAAAAGMTEAAFTAAWRPKALGLTHVHAAFAAQRRGGGLPRLVVFGSILGLTGNAGQANYAAGSAYQWAVAEALAAEGADLRAIAWGYWGEAGRVANAAHRRRLARIGLPAMTTQQAVAAFEAALAGQEPAVVIARLDPGRAAALTAKPKHDEPERRGLGTLAALDALAAARLHAAFAAAGWLEYLDQPEAAGVAADQRPLFRAACAILRRHAAHAAAAPDPDGIAAGLRAAEPWMEGVIRLIDAAVPRIVEVLRGAVPGTQVMFPGGDMDLVGGFYAGNRLADEANARVAQQVAAAVGARLAASPDGAVLRILEVGAGTGATTAPVLDALAPYAARIAYVFSDLSMAFIQRARRRFGAARPWFSAERFDFDGDPAEFAALGQFDLILAANAVHVTAEIGAMLDRLSRRLSPAGLLVLNELMRPMDHLTLTFGLLPGWWVAADQRAGSGPLLTSDGWRRALAGRFDVLSLDGVSDRDGLVQGVLVASVRAVAADPAPIRREDGLVATIAAIVAEVVQAAPGSLAPDTLFADLGLDSILSLELVDRIAAAFAVTLDPVAIIEHGTAVRLAALVAARGGHAVGPEASSGPAALPPAASAPAARRPAVSSDPGADPGGNGKVAIVGMAGVLPGAESLAALMARLAAGNSGIGHVPPGRWSAPEIAFWNAAALTDMKAGFVADAGGFDAALFGLSAREALLMDPQQRLLLEQAWAALADAGGPHLAEDMAAATGVFVGASAGDWTLKLALAGKEMEPQSLAAQLPSSMAARLSHAFSLTGPAMTVDLACASGLAALHLAVEALGRGECRLALVGAVSLMTTPQFPMLVARAGLLSPSGQPRPFTQESDGIVLGEGAIVLVLKPLDSALDSGDRIHAVIDGTALSQAGNADGLTAPSLAAQTQTMRRAMAAAGVVAGDIAAIEAHGVGTPAADATERAALAEVLGPHAGRLPLDTLKPATGHMLAVSGLAAVARAALAAKGRTLVHGFSLNGACAAALLSQVQSRQDRPAPASAPAVITIGATLEPELHERLGALRAWLLAANPPLAEVAWLLGAPRAKAAWRAVFTVADEAALVTAIDGALATRANGPSWWIGRAGSAGPDMVGRMTAAGRPPYPCGYPFLHKRLWPTTPAEPAAPGGAGSGNRALAIIGRVLALAMPLEEQSVLLDLGLDSILAIELRDALAREADLAVSLADLLSRQPIGAVLAAAGAAEAVERITPEPDKRFQPFGLTDLQLAYLVGRSPAVPLGGTGCHVYWEFLSDTPLSVARLEEAWNQLVLSHDMLRAVFSADAGQCVQPAVPPTRIAVHDWRAAPEAAAAGLAALRDRMAHEVFDPARWPLFRIELSHAAEGSRLHVSIDLLIVDVLSLFGLLRQWGRLYADPAAMITPPAVFFRDYVGYLARRQGGAEHARALAFWRDELPQLPDAPALPRARPDEALAGARFLRRRGELPPAAWNRLQAAARACGATPAAVIAAAFGATLAHWTRADVALNVTVYDRRSLHPEIHRVIGDFTSTILLPIGSDGAEGFAARARAVAADLARRLEHTAVSSVEALRRFGLGRRVPFVLTSMLGYDPVIGADDGITSLGRLDYGVTQTPQVLLDAQIYTEGGRLVFTWDSVEEAFSDGLIAAMFEAYAETIAWLAQPEADWGRSATQAIAACEAARRDAINATEMPVAADLLHEPLLRAALAAPDVPAVIAPDGSWSRGDLVCQAMAIAAAIPPPGRDELVVVALDKGALQIAAVLGVMIAGGAYLPLDPGLPAARFRRLVERGEARTVVTTGHLAMQLSLPEGVTIVAAEALPPAALPAALPPRRAGIGDLAYVLFTSGSTGEPKGVMIDHRAALNTVLDINRRFAVGPHDRILGLSALGFDLSVYDIFGPLAAGGALVLPDPAHIRDPDRLTALVASAGVTVWNSVPMFLDLLVAAEPAREALAALRLVLVSGDWVPLRLPGALAAIAPQARLVALGGATEAAIWSIFHEVGPLDPAWRSVPYGRPLANQSFQVLDAAMMPCADGEEGELYIGGIGVARGYWRDAARTAAAFVTDARTGQRLYRTGDMGRWRDGMIEFLGRQDGQVKIGGHRIELGEVEMAALSHAGIGHAIAVAAAAGGGRRQLHLFVTGAGGTAPAPGRLQAHLAACLPGYMVPRWITVLDALPLTANGKVDRGALLARADAPAAVPAETSAPVSRQREVDLSAAIARILSAALDGRAIDPDMSLFELGADSLTAVAVNRRLRQDLGLPSNVTDLFEHPSVNRLARYFARQAADAEPARAASETRPAEATVQDRRAALRRSFRDTAAFSDAVS
jgi:amino acid adenylation domain-containing protein